MASVDLDIPRAREGLRKMMLGRLDAMGRASVARARAIAPRKTGRLANSLYYTVNASELFVRFGTDLLYGRLKEIGTRKMPPESYIRRTMLELRNDYVRIAERGR